MNKLLWIIALLLFAAACSKEEAPVAAPSESVAADSQATDTEEAVAEEPADAAEETLEVVEESASEAEPSDEAIVLAMAESPAVTREWRFKEGQHFVRMVPTQPTVGGADKIEVAAFFMYSCPHCYDMEPYINRWAENKDPNVRFVRVPATWNALVRLHAQLYYTEEVLARNGIIKDPAAFHDAIFQEYHKRGNRMTSKDAIQKLFARFGNVSAEDFERTWSSFEVDQKLRVAGDLARRYSVAAVPAVVVNGKYRTDAAMAGNSYPKLMEVIDELTVREGLR